VHATALTFFMTTFQSHHSMRGIHASSTVNPSQLPKRGKLLSHLIHICQCPPFSNSKVEWEILSFEVRPAHGSIIPGPLVIQVSIECKVIVEPRVTTTGSTLRSFGPISAQVVDVKWEQRGCLRRQSVVDLSVTFISQGA
jgi:hypothetical protein